MAKKILLVEDEVYTRELYTDLLKEAGYEVVAVGDGEAALSAAANGGFDLILLDIIMPKKDGLAFLKDFQSLRSQNLYTKIVMLTVLGEDSTIKNCMELGAIGYLVKSELTPDFFIKEVQSYLTSPS